MLLFTILTNVYAAILLLASFSYPISTISTSTSLQLYPLLLTTILLTTSLSLLLLPNPHATLSQIAVTAALSTLLLVSLDPTLPSSTPKYLPPLLSLSFFLPSALLLLLSTMTPPPPPPPPLASASNTTSLTSFADTDANTPLLDTDG